MKVVSQRPKFGAKTGSWYKPRMEPLPSDDLYKERYTVEKKIGQGGFGKVFLVKEKGGETCYAAKFIKVRVVFK